MVRKKRASTAKKKTTSRPRRRRGRISGANDLSGMLTSAATVTGGYVAGRELADILLKMFPSLDLKIISAGQIAVGLFLPKFWKSPLSTDLAKGMIAIGGGGLLVELGVIQGIPGVGGSNTMKYRVRKMNGTGNLNVISGTGRLNVINGFTTRTSSTPTNTGRAQRNFATQV